MSVIVHFLGPEWAHHNLNPATSDPYFLFDRKDGDDVAKGLREHRVVSLGRRLYELQGVPGFEDMMTALRTRNLEGAAAELYAVSLLRGHHPVRFVSPTGVKGADYDAECEVDGVAVAVEVKAKPEAGVDDYRDKSIVNSLKKASVQVPASGPSLVFLYVPSDWAGDDMIRIKIDCTIRQWLRSSTRINAVILIVEQRVHGEETGLRFHFGHDVIPNPRPRSPIRNILSILG